MDIKRREFLKITGLLGAGLIGPLNIREADPYNVWKALPPEQMEKSETICPLCPSFCPMTVLKKRELVFGLYPKTGGYGLCARGIAYHNIIYNEDRIKTPLVRTGKKGEVAFKAVDYDTALSILKERFKKGAFHIDAFAPGESEKYYLNALAGKINLHPGARLKAVTGADRIFFDFENADIIVHFGGDILNNRFAQAASTLVQKARQTITFSPMVTTGTAFGETWYPVPVNGCKSVVTGIRKALGKNVKESFEETERMCGISKDEFARIARRIRAAKKACVSFDEAILEYSNGTDIVKAILELTKELNAVNHTGGTFFYSEKNGSRPFDVMLEKIDTYFAYDCDPSMLYPVKELEERLKALPFLIVMTHHHNGISRYADLILPSVFHVEKAEGYIRNKTEYAKTNPGVEGGVEAFELRKKENIEVIFQKILNYKAPFGIKDLDEISAVLKPGVMKKERYLKSAGDNLQVSTVMPVLPKKMQEVNGTPDLSLYLYQDRILDANNRGSKWAEEMSRDNKLLVNSSTAQKLNLKNGAVAALRTKSGEIKVTIMIYEGIADGTLGLKRWKKTTIAGAYAGGKVAAKDKDVTLIWWQNEDKPIEHLLSYKAGAYKIACFEAEGVEIKA